MSKEVGIYTETMAKVYASQGHWAKAAEIYRHLLTEAPARKDFADALAEAEKKISNDSLKDPEQLVPLFREWIELLFKHDKLQKLRNLRRQ
ncbi:MAG: hypothetical protein V2J65_17475 [Desulfobacteraceae bacterium]|jgi:hypothetical protein|nr:hypothetical protein [Desulfobacteraceae bacterium]